MPRAVGIHAPGAPAVLELLDRPAFEHAEGEVRIAVWVREVLQRTDWLEQLRELAWAARCGGVGAKTRVRILSGT